MKNENYRYNSLTSVADTMLWKMEEGIVLSDEVLNHVFNDYIKTYPKTLLAKHCRWLLNIFPEVERSSFDKKNPVKDFSDILRIQDVKNSGSILDARTFCSKQISSDNKVVYWTGGLQFTKAHYKVAKHLLKNKNKILIGLEDPESHGERFGKERGGLWGKEVPFSLWSKLLKENGFIFPIPSQARPEKEHTFHFYDFVYEVITNREIPIVVSKADQFLEKKKRMGPTIKVPFFNEPSTTQLYESVFL